MIGMILVYYQSLVWFRYNISHWYIMPMTDNIPESCHWLMICLNHTNDWWYVWIISMTDNMSKSYQWLIVWEWFRHIISHWHDSDIISVIGMIQTYHQSMVWFKHIISHWYDSGILSVIGMIQVYHQLNHAIDWWYVWIIPMTDDMSESYQWLIICLNHTNDW
jgi:hypothetical protein